MITVLPMLIQDIPACVLIEAQLFTNDSPWDYSSFITELSNPFNNYFIAKHQNTLVGYAGIGHLGGTKKHSEIHTLAVASTYQKQGIGKILLTKLLTLADQHSQETFLEVRTDNFPAIKLYKTFNFKIIGIRKKYYPASRMDAYTMQRTIYLDKE